MHSAKFKFLVMKETIANFHDDVFLLLHVRPEFIFFSFIFKIVNPCEVKIAIALICKRKQNPEGLCSSRKYPDPHHGGNWKFQGGGGVRGPGNSRREGGWTIKSLSRGAISFRFRPEFEHCFLTTW